MAHGLVHGSCAHRPGLPKVQLRNIVVEVAGVLIEGTKGDGLLLEEGGIGTFLGFDDLESCGCWCWL